MSVMNQPVIESTHLVHVEPRAFTQLAPRRTLSRWILCLTGIAWVALAATLCGCRPMSGYVMNESGKGYYRRGNYMAARMEFERALMDRPYSPDYAHNLAAAMSQTGDTAAAEQMYRHALLLDPSHQPSYHALAGLLNSQGRGAEAQQLVQTWVETQPYVPEAHLEMSWLMQQQGNLLAAEESAHQALRINPRHPRAMADLGRIYARGGRGREAAAMYQRSLALNPYQTRVHSDLAYLNYPSGYSPGLQMANTLPYVDPALQGGPVLAGRGFRGRNPFAGPMMASPQMTPAYGVMPEQMQVGSYLPGPAPVMQAAPTWNTAPMTSVPAYTSNVPSPQIPYGATSVPYGAPLPIDTSTQPVQLGAPIPTTMVPSGQFFSATGGTMQSVPISSGYGTTIPMTQYGQPMMQPAGYPTSTTVGYPMAPQTSFPSAGTLPYPAAGGTYMPAPAYGAPSYMPTYAPTSMSLPSGGPSMGSPNIIGFSPPTVQAF